jgi:hypothetical protein
MLDKIGGFIWDAYCWGWYNFLWWMEKTARRPFTFFIHDFSHKYPIPYFIIQAAICYGLYRLTDSIWVFVPILYGFCQGHFLWNDFKIGQQEQPTYTEED